MCIMEPQRHQSNSGRPPRCAALILLVILFFGSTAAASGGATPRAALAAHHPAGTYVVADSWSLGRAFGKVETFLSDRRRMIQLATIGMLIGLYILLRK